MVSTIIATIRLMKTAEAPLQEAGEVEAAVAEAEAEVEVEEGEAAAVVHGDEVSAWTQIIPTISFTVAHTGSDGAHPQSKKHRKLHSTGLVAVQRQLWRLRSQGSTIVLYSMQKIG